MLSIYSRVKNLDAETIKQMGKVASTALTFLNQPNKQLVFNVYFVSEKKIRQINNEKRNIDRKTDVLSFPMLDLTAGEVIDFNKFSIDIDLTNNTLLVGEIVICNQVAIKQAKKYGHSYTREVCFLLLHGILHCLGYDHIDADDRLIMEDLQRKILDKCNIKRG